MRYKQYCKELLWLITLTVITDTANAQNIIKGYEPGNPLREYKTPAPFEYGKDSGEFYGNGVGKKNRTQGNEYVKSRMYQHGISCINCHNPHKLDNTTDKPLGDES